MKTKISIVVPVFNAETTIEKCINSILQQSYSNIEIIIVNDGSTDGSKYIIDKYEKQYKNIKAMHTTNKGVSNARNIGIKISTGEFIGFVDSDDSIEKDMYKELSHSMILDEKMDLCICCMSKGKNKEVKRENLTKEEVLYKYVSDKNIGGFLCNKLFRSKIIKDNNIRLNPNVHMCEDLLFCVNYLKYTSKIELINNSYYNYDTRGISSSTFNEKRYSVIKAYEEVIKITKKNFNDKIIINRMKNNLLRHEIWLWYSLKKNGNKDMKNKYLNIIEKKIKKENYDFIFASGYRLKYKVVFAYIKLKKGCD